MLLRRKGSWTTVSRFTKIEIDKAKMFSKSSSILFQILQLVGDQIPGTFVLNVRRLWSRLPPFGQVLGSAAWCIYCTKAGQNIQDLHV